MAEPSPAPPPDPRAFTKALERNAAGLELVDRAMYEQLRSQSDLLGQLGEHVFASGGKRIRPALLLMAAELCGYSGARRIQLGAALEMVHTATLLHDDVVDFSELRRGRPSASALWGNRRAILVGDFFYARASAMIVDDGNLDILLIFANTIRSMAEGELLQLELSYDPMITESHYFRVIECKCAALLSASCELGSMLGGVTRAERRRLADFGRELGIAFQLRDDALDYEAGEEELGKRPYTDLHEGKVTFPLLLTLKRCAPEEREFIASVLKDAARCVEFGASSSDEAARRDALDVKPVLDLIQRYHGVSDTVRRAREYAQRAAAAIAPFPEGQGKADLLAAAQFAVTRDR